VLELFSMQLADGRSRAIENLDPGAEPGGFAKRYPTRTTHSGDVIRPNRVKPRRGACVVRKRVSKVRRAAAIIPSITRVAGWTTGDEKPGAQPTFDC
jgi:hypothetical protein